MIKYSMMSIECQDAEVNFFNGNPGRPELSIKEKETGKNCDLNLVFDVEQMEKLTIQAAQCAVSDYNGLNTERLKDLGEKIVELAERIENRK